MKVLQVNCVYKTGSTGKIVYDIHRELQERGMESVVCYGRGQVINEGNVHKTCGELYSYANHFLANVTGIMYGGCFFSTNRLISIIKREKPDIVHLHCINGYFVNIYRLVKWLKKNRVKTVITLHAEFMYTGGCGHALECEQWRSESGCAACPCWREETGSLFFDRTPAMWLRMKRAFEGFDEGLVVTSVSPWLRERAKASPILRHCNHQVVMNGVDTEVFYPCSEEVAVRLRNELGIGQEKVVFHATAFFSGEPGHFKGGHYVLELARQLPGVRFVVAGPLVGDVQAPDNVILLGRVDDQKRLAALYSMADVTLLTSKRETFSMVAAESLCCGTPVVGFKAGGPETIALPDWSAFVPQGAVDALELALRAQLTIPYEAGPIAKKAQETYGKKAMCGQYLAGYEALLKER